MHLYAACGLLLSKSRLLCAPLRTLVLKYRQWTSSVLEVWERHQLDLGFHASSLSSLLFFSWSLLVIYASVRCCRFFDDCLHAWWWTAKFLVSRCAGCFLCVMCWSLCSVKVSCVFCCVRTTIHRHRACAYNVASFLGFGGRCALPLSLESRRGCIRCCPHALCTRTTSLFAHPHSCALFLCTDLMHNNHCELIFFPDMLGTAVLC